MTSTMPVEPIEQVDDFDEDDFDDEFDDDFEEEFDDDEPRCDAEETGRGRRRFEE